MSAYNVVRQFEHAIATYAGCKHAIAVDTCTAAIFLCCKYIFQFHKTPEVTIPCHTYPSIPMEIIHAGGKVKFEDIAWSGIYELKPYYIIDGAKRFRPGMYEEGSYHCLSFHYKKHLPIGRGGMILTNNSRAHEWLCQARFMGRHENVPLNDDTFTMCGWNLYMDPPRAARGLALFQCMDQHVIHPDLFEHYPDLSKQQVFNE